MYTKTTRDVRITVQPIFLEDQSDPEEHRFVWAYRVVIENTGEETVRLINRHWRIVDGRGRIQEVRGAGVVGEQPTLHAGEKFDYTSGTPLQTPSGFMDGAYEMADSRGRPFKADIPPFSLDSPHSQATLN